MAEYIDTNLEALLEKKAAELTAEQRYLHAVAERARLLSNFIIENLVRDIRLQSLPLQQEATTKADRIIVSTQMAGVLALTGIYHGGSHVRSEDITLASDATFEEVTFESVTASVTAALSREVQQAPGFSKKIDRSIISPNAIYEGDVVISAEHKGSDQTVSVRHAWLNTGDMPESYRNARRHFVPAADLYSTMDNVLSALTDEELNPQFRTLPFIDGIGEELGKLVRNVEVPVTEVADAMLLPAWLKERGTTSSLTRT